MIRTALATLLLLPALAWAAAPKTAPKAAPKAQEKVEAKAAGKWMKAARAGKPIYATLHTSQGDIVLRLFSSEAPHTVENFVGLASGEKEWTNPESHKLEHRPLYDGVIFHRVIPGFMIQGGDPLGQGFGGPGYTFPDELQSGRVFDRPGIVAMANSGPNTNGSQFFITVGPAPHLNHHYSIFGEVVSGYDVVEKIATAPRGAQDRPVQPVTIKHISLSEKAPKAEKKK